MKLYVNDRTDPYFNLASEEYLLLNESEPVFMLWQNEKSVIIGRNQNAYAEINRDFVDEKGIAVVRRLTGGGAVFHDLGNINYTFITEKGDAGALDFARFCAPVISALTALGVPAELSGRNDMTADGRKFSGNAQCVFNQRVLHHGTILFSADMSYLSGALNADPEKMKSKGIKSVRSRVCNLIEYLPGYTAEKLKNYLENSVNAEKTSFSPEQTAGIEKLSREKYSTWEWNYGRSKEYENKAKERFPFGSVEVCYTAENGRIADVRISGDYFSARPVNELESSLFGCRLIKEELSERLSDVGEYISGAEPDQIAALFIKT
ncbi:MAG: lipoate--protein ligase [Clostridia bacterium]|nr:lipoate--protein ligase [Clostridia bacterium]